jgi:hypothetical protein
VPSIGGATGSATLAGIRYFAALNEHSLTALKASTCSGVQIRLTQAEVDEVASAIPSGAADVTGTTATMPGTLRGTDGSSAKVLVHLRQESGNWCLSSTTRG